MFLVEKNIHQGKTLLLKKALQHIVYTCLIFTKDLMKFINHHTQLLTQENAKGTIHSELLKACV